MLVGEEKAEAGKPAPARKAAGNNDDPSWHDREKHCKMQPRRPEYPVGENGDQERTVQGGDKTSRWNAGGLLSVAA